MSERERNEINIGIENKKKRNKFDSIKEETESDGHLSFQHKYNN